LRKSVGMIISNDKSKLMVISCPDEDVTAVVSANGGNQVDMVEL